MGQTHLYDSLTTNRKERSCQYLRLLEFSITVVDTLPRTP